MGRELNTLIDSILDATILFSFDRSGYERHAKHFDPGDLDVDLSGRVALVTGANGGLGKAAAAGLASRGSQVWMLVRNRARGEAAADEIRADLPDADLRIATVDMSDLASVRRFVAGFDRDRVDALVHNAGALAHELTTTEAGIETTFATHVVGPYLMTRLLAAELESAPQGRVVWVSSGGMYSQRLDVGKLVEPPEPFNGTKAYAQAKRAQVVLSELLADELSGSSVTSNAMHPGWAATPGVADSLPAFDRIMGNRLRSAEQGADTIIWLAAAKAAAVRSGAFFLDRAARRTHYVPGTRESPEQRERVVETLDSLTQGNQSADELRRDGQDATETTKGSST